jgi:phytoene synthase
MDELTAAGITEPRLRASYQECKKLNSKHGKTYYLATLLLPKEKRPYVHALYG